ncbi:SGNH/GDSL hydrolase family protein [Stackebrandtia nassauensis]|uniref:SGNH/GDSL hydrolase family protein n=1 Tax=Stackebrandtia nassauensis TaxID=283811 RepID=UPI0011853E4D|nr:SGNH/GDSL hydrolase family protein [Stackebrandtia nassauensis]
MTANIGLSANSADPQPPDKDPDLRPATQTQSISVMPLGDSITGSPGCWRSLLWNELKQHDYQGIDFVGSMKSVPCGRDFDGDHEGYRGLKVTDAARNAKFLPTFKANRPDIVLMHFGTNDIWRLRPGPDPILDAYSTILKQLRAANPRVTLLVAQLIPMSPKSCRECIDDVAELNTAIPEWVRAHGTKKSPVISVDQWTGFDVKRDTGDGVHPNGSGTEKLAANWFKALRPLLDNRN